MRRFSLRGSPFPSPFEAPPCDSDRAVGGKRLAGGRTVCIPAPATYPPTIVRLTLTEARTRRRTPTATVKRVRSAATPAGATTGTAVACCYSCVVASGTTAVAASVHSRRGPLPHRLPKQRGGRPSNQSPTAVSGGAQPRTLTRCRAPRTPPASPLTAAAARLSRAARHVTRNAAGDNGISQRNGFAPRARARGGTSELSGAVLPPAPFPLPTALQ